MQFAEELGFDAVTFPEHDLHSEGFEVGVPPGFPVYEALSPYQTYLTALLDTFCVAWIRSAWLP